MTTCSAMFPARSDLSDWRRPSSDRGMIAMLEEFGDTSGWMTFFVATEPHHLKAQALLRRWHNSARTVVTTNYVLAELVAPLMSRGRGAREQKWSIPETIRSLPWVRVVHITPELDARAWDLLKKRPDKDWSLVDCASFVVMDDRGITDALTTDGHFEQAGFVRLSK